MGDVKKDEEDKKEKVIDDIETNSKLLGISSRTGKQFKSGQPQGFGLCSTCSNFIFIKTEFSVIYTDCEYLENSNRSIILTQERPITECSNYSKKGSLSLRNMYGMATLIEDKEKKVAGFKILKP